MNNTKILISGGGTGGHVFPAIAIANALKKLDSQIQIHFVGAKGRMEMEKVPAAGYTIDGLNVMGLQRSLSLKNLAFPFKLAGSLIKARRIIQRFNPDVVVGVGGYASGPTLRMASKMGIPTLIQEQNSFPGITNRMLAAKATKICVAYEEMERFFPEEKIIVTGNPVRHDILDIQHKREEALAAFGLSGQQKVLLVVGGSLGARTINESIRQSLEYFRKENIQLIWQTGKLYFPQAAEAVNRFEGNGFRAFDFISRMDLAYAAADVVVSRAGAIAISELCIVGKPAILVPSPNVAEDHQTRNAMALVNDKAAWLVKDVDARDILAQEVITLFNNESEMKSLAENIRKKAKPNAANSIAEIVLSLKKEKR